MRRQGLMATLMLDARLHACPRAAPLGPRQSAWRPPVAQHVRCLASKRPEEKSWAELAGNDVIEHAYALSRVSTNNADLCGGSLLADWCCLAVEHSMASHHRS